MIRLDPGLETADDDAGPLSILDSVATCNLILVYLGGNC